MIRTVPQPVHDGRRYTVTANEYLALPEIGWDDGACYSINVMTSRARGLVEFRGGALGEGRGGEEADPLPLFAPCLRLEGRAVACPWRLSHESAWLPVFTADVAEGLRVHARYLVPPGEKGLALALEVHNQGAAARAVAFGWRFVPALLAVGSFSRRPWGGAQRLYWDPWTEALTWEGLAGHPEVALAVRPPQEARWSPGRPKPGRLAVSVCEEILPSGGSCGGRWMVGVNLDGDGAGLGAVHLARRGWESLHGDATAHLAGLLADLPPATGEEALREALARNLLFNLHFAAGRTLDGEEAVLVTSRSPRYYVSGAHWSRDSLLWSLPGALELSPRTAREWLVTAFRRYTRHPGVHAQYLDGQVLYPGFELDQLAAFWIALARYVRRTQDRSVLTDPSVTAALPALEAAAREAYDPGVGLLRTFLLPSDDPAPYPFVIYDNALFWVAWRERAALYPDRGAAGLGADLLDRLRDAIRRHGVVEGPLGARYAGATDGRGRHVLYDEPPGSLELLAYYGFCDPDDPVYRNTLRWLHSDANPHYLPESRFGHVGCPHAPDPWVLAWCNGLLSGRAGEVLGYLRKAPLDAGLACETVDPQLGSVRTGAGFAACAGFLGYALARWLRGGAEWYA